MNFTAIFAFIQTTIGLFPGPTCKLYWQSVKWNWCVESGYEAMWSLGTRPCGVWERDYVESGSKTMWSLGTRSLDSSWSSVQHDLLHICTHKPSRSQETERARVIKLRELGLHLHAHLQYTLITMRKNGNLLHKGLQGLRELSKRPEDQRCTNL